MTFAEWFESDGREAVAACGLGAVGASVRGICQRAFEAGAREGIAGAGRAAEGKDYWVADFYLLGVIPVGSMAIGQGLSRGQAWLDARLHVRRFLRPLIGIEVRT